MHNRRLVHKLVLIPLWLLFVLVVVGGGIEGTIRILDFDWKLAERSFYYQTNQLRVHRPDMDPRILFRLRPGWVLQNHWTLINSMGARSPERPVKKPPGVFRIIVLGASNAFGSPDIHDNETWPAQLEAKLNEVHPGRYEVWNFGAHAYVGSQMAALGEEMSKKLNPDLIIMGLANKGQRPFLWSAPIQPYFEKHPELWREVFPEQLYQSPRFLSEESILYLIQHVRLYRYALLVYTHYVLKQRPWQCAEHEPENIRAVREMIIKLKDRIPVCLFVGPHLAGDRYQDYYTAAGGGLLVLEAEGLPDEYRKIHPPPHVFTWYGENIAKWVLAKYPLEGAAK